MMCARLDGTEKTLAELEACGTEYLHIDIMDGHFVPNFMLGTDYCKETKRLCGIPLDIHLMIERPEDKISWFPVGEGDIVSVHAESTPHLQKALAAIRAAGGSPFVALNPATPLAVIEEVIDSIDGVLIMCVNPGFAGQKAVPGCLDKITRCRALLDGLGREDASIEVDGNCTFENAVKMREAGADIFVVGTSSVFGYPEGLTRGMEKMRRCVT